MREINQELLKELFDYREDGAMINRIRRRGNKLGAVAGALAANYNHITLFKKTYLAHRIVFLWHHGWLPPQVDHINGNKRDNRIENLRAADASTNAMNRRAQSRAKTGVKNVGMDRNGRFRVQVSVGGTTHHLGSFESLALASLVAAEARAKHHGEFANHGALKEPIPC